MSALVVTALAGVSVQASQTPEAGSTENRRLIIESAAVFGSIKTYGIVGYLHSVYEPGPDRSVDIEQRARAEAGMPGDFAGKRFTEINPVSERAWQGNVADTTADRLVPVRFGAGGSGSAGGMLALSARPGSPGASRASRSVAGTGPRGGGGTGGDAIADSSDEGGLVGPPTELATDAEFVGPPVERASVPNFSWPTPAPAPMIASVAPLPSPPVAPSAPAPSSSSPTSPSGSTSPTPAPAASSPPSTSPSGSANPEPAPSRPSPTSPPVSPSPAPAPLSDPDAPAPVVVVASLTSPSAPPPAPSALSAGRPGGTQDAPSDLTVPGKDQLPATVEWIDEQNESDMPDAWLDGVPEGEGTEEPAIMQIPAPATLLLIAIGGAGMACSRRRRTALS